MVARRSGARPVREHRFERVARAQKLSQRVVAARQVEARAVVVRVPRQEALEREHAFAGVPAVDRGDAEVVVELAIAGRAGLQPARRIGLGRAPFLYQGAQLVRGGRARERARQREQRCDAAQDGTTHRSFFLPGRTERSVSMTQAGRGASAAAVAVEADRWFR